MLRILGALMAVVLAGAGGPARAQGLADCNFGFAVDTQSSAFQAMVVDGEQKHGFWLSIARAPREVREFGRFIGRLQVCLMTPDGKPRTVTRGTRTITLDSPFVTNCTASLLPGNRLLTNRHCYYDPSLFQAGFTIVREARVNFNYTSKDDTGDVQTFLVSPSELAVDEDLDAMVLQIMGGDANAALGGHIPMKMMTRVEPFQNLLMIHHPGAEPQQYSAGSCQVHRRQSEIPPDRSPFRHTCESMGGSSGSLLLDARTLAVVALHNQGGLAASGESYNGGHKIEAINAALSLGFEPYAPDTSVTPDASLDVAAAEAFGDAMLEPDLAARRDMLQAILQRYPGAAVAPKVSAMLDQMGDPAPVTPPVTTPDKTPGQTLAQRMEASADVQDCDRLAGQLFHPDQARGLMRSSGVYFRDMDGPAALRACQAAANAFPDVGRVQAFLGRAYEKVGDYDNAHRSYQAAAALGDPAAQNSLGEMYYNGIGVARSYPEALKWYRLAEAQGDPNAQSNLGDLFFYGRGVGQSYPEAIRLFSAAAGRGQTAAQNNLAYMNERGYGMPSNPARAVDYYVGALLAGDSWAIERASNTWARPTARALQQELRNRGVYTGGVDGSIGPQTKAAMRRLLP